MNLTYLLVPHALSDEAAAQLSELFNDLALSFDGHYFAQINRYYDERRESERRAITGSSNSSSMTTRRSERPPAPASTHTLRARPSPTGAVANPSSPQPPRSPRHRCTPTRWLSGDDGAM